MDQTSKSVLRVVPRIISFSAWLEDCPDLHVWLIRCPAGVGFPNEGSGNATTMAIIERVRVGNLNRVLREHTQDNLWRSWQLYSDSLCSKPISYIPFLIDIDNEQDNLESAHSLTQDCLFLLKGMSQFTGPDRLRVVFSGQKGFHIEARPTELLDYAQVRRTLLNELAELRGDAQGAINCFQDSIIDLGHDFIRVTDSLNSWRADNVLKRRRVIQFSLDEFQDLQLQDILERSECA